MNTRLSSHDLAIALCSRSICRVQVGAVISDQWGIFSWGWNHSGDSTGMHAEQFALLRANRKRLKGAKITVAAIRRPNRQLITAKPCEERCSKLIAHYGIAIVEFTIKSGGWEIINFSPS
ncbi:MAG: hypothetical protein U1A25_02000 [Candidatus Sungbacteria bacterium]|nr:hypothetical protein [bacterium]MDZ4260413.1 hypothetical protein [Candidatus Sungbacteria bacterium]